MNLGIKRKKRLSEFTIKEYGVNGVLMMVLFLFGLYLSWKLSTYAMLLYLLLWVGSYFVIHATTCRNCAYYGKHCPVPFEGSCSHIIFGRGKNFGLFSLVGASFAYILRISIPCVAIFHSGSILYFILYMAVFILFFYVLLFHTGCPNCIHIKCPLNPDYSS